MPNQQYVRVVQCEEWCHIVDKAFFAPNMWTVSNANVFCVSQPISLERISIDRRNAEDFAEIRSGIIFKALVD